MRSTFTSKYTFLFSLGDKLERLNGLLKVKGLWGSQDSISDILILSPASSLLFCSWLLNFTLFQIFNKINSTYIIEIGPILFFTWPYESQQITINKKKSKLLHGEVSNFRGHIALFKFWDCNSMPCGKKTKTC